MSGSTGSAQKKRLRNAPLVWGSSVLAAGVLVLGVNGTLSTWTQAIITNGSNTAGATTAVALSETNGSIVCDTSTATDGSNSVANCNIDKYGGNLAMSPNQSKTVDVTFENTGNGNAASLKLAPGTCTDSAAAAGVSAGTLCGDGNLTVAMSCSDGATYTPASAYTDLAWSAKAPNDQTAVTRTATIAPGAKITCQFTTTLVSTAPTTVASMSISQPLTWTLAS